MAPPKLTRNAPWLDIFQPVIIDFFAAFRHNLGAPITHGIQRGANDFSGVHKPLIGQHGFNHHARAIAKGLHDRLLLDHNHQPFAINIGHHALAGFKAVKIAVLFWHQIDRINLGFGKGAAGGKALGFCHFFGIGCAITAHNTARVHQSVHGDRAAFGDLIVICVMGAGDFYRARSKVRIGIVVSDNRDQPAVRFRANRNFTHFTHNRRIAGVIGVHGHRAIAQHGFRPCGGD